MRGSIKQRYPGSWSLIFDLGSVKDPVTGKVKRKQKWITFYGSEKDAEKKLTELRGAGPARRRGGGPAGGGDGRGWTGRRVSRWCAPRRAT